MKNDKPLKRAEIIAALGAIEVGGVSGKYYGSYLFRMQDALTDAAALLEQDAEPPNDPLTLEELRGMDGEPVWCEDDIVGAGIIRIAEDWATEQMEAHFWIFNTDGNPRCYNVRLMLEMGAEFYRRKPDGGGE